MSDNEIRLIITAAVAILVAAFFIPIPYIALGVFASVAVGMGVLCLRAGFGWLAKRSKAHRTPASR